MNKETKKQMLIGIGALFSMFAIMIVGSIFAMATFGFLAISILWDLSFFSLILSWTFLFYIFSVIIYPMWENLSKRVKL